MKIFPHILVRIGGNSYDFLSSGMTFNALGVLTDFILNKEIQFKEVSNELSKRLYDFIGSTKDTSIQNFVLNIRRDIFNAREIKEEKIEICSEVLPHSIKTMLDKYLIMRCELDVLKIDGSKKYSEEVIQARRTLQTLAKNETLQQGLVLSSRALLESIENYSYSDVKTFTKKELRTELSLLKYLVRMCTKTSPFSTFTQLSTAEMRNIPDRVIESYGDNASERPYAMHIRLNNYLFKHLKDYLFNSEDIAMFLPLRLNPTITDHQNQLHYLMNWNQVETFQHLKCNTVLTLIRQHIADAANQPFTIRKIKEFLLLSINASEDEIIKYLRRLIELGFLEFDLCISGVDPDWDQKLIAFLEPLATESPVLYSIIDALTVIRHHANCYSKADIDDRKKLQDAMLEEFKNVCETLHALRVAKFQEADQVLTPQQSFAVSDGKNTSRHLADQLSAHSFPFKPEGIFYEDVTRQVVINFDQKAVHGFMNKMDVLLMQLQFLDTGLDERHKMEIFFCKKYGNATISLLDFYKDYYREFKLAEKEADRNRREKTSSLLNPDDLPAHKKFIQSWAERFGKRLKDQKVNDGVVYLDRQILLSTNAELDFRPKKQSDSYGALVQFFKEADQDGKYQLKGVINNNVPGYGKLLSRYLHILDEQVLSDTVTWNASMEQKDELFVENCDGSYFNANIHPVLMPYEISAPGSHNSLPSSKQIALRDLDVLYNEADKRLMLRHRSSGHDVNMFDLGFQSSYFRSELFKLLNSFSRGKHIAMKSISQMIRYNLQEKLIYNDIEIKVRPRIVYEDQIIIERKSWQVPKLAIPIKANEESDWGYFYKVRQWQKSLELPDQVFVIVNPSGRFRTQKETDAKTAKDDYKPQYIDFRNPLLVRLLQTISARVQHSIKIEEMYPTPEKMLEFGNERFVTEFLVQGYNFSN